MSTDLATLLGKRKVKEIDSDEEDDRKTYLQINPLEKLKQFLIAKF